MVSAPRRAPLLGLATALALAAAPVACFSSSSGGPASDIPDGAFAGDDATDSTVAPTPDAPSGDVTVDAPPGDAGADAPMDAGNAVADSPADTSLSADAPLEATADAAAPGVYVDPVNGLDSNPGTEALPFQTIYHASIVLSAPDAGAGQTVYLADGTYDGSTQTNFAATFTNPTFVRGSAAANVILLGTHSNEGLYFNAGGGVSNVTFRNTTTSFQVRGGTFTTSGVVLDGLPGFNGAAMSFVNGTVATLNSTTIVNMNSAGGQDIGACLYADNTANVTWHAAGNTIVAPASAPGFCIFARGAAQLAIDGLTVTNFPDSAAVLYDQAGLTLTNSTITGSAPGSGICSDVGCRASIWLGGSQTGVPTGTLILDGVTISGSPGSAVGYTPTTNTAAVSLAFTNSHLDGNAYNGLWIHGATNPALAIQVTANGTTFDRNGISGITSSTRATMSLTGGSVSQNGGGAAAAALSQTSGGVVFLDGASANALTMRGATLATNVGNAIAFAGTAAAILDLGTTASPGGLTFSGIPAGAGLAALNLTALINATAVGNTWMSGVQGASAAGQYTAATTLTGPTSGLNANVPSGATVVVE